MAAGPASGSSRAIASRFDRRGASSGGIGTDACAGGESPTAEGTVTGLLVSKTTLSGHLRSDLIRMAALSMTSGWSGKGAEASGKDQLAINRRRARAAPTTLKYPAMGTAEHSRDFS